MSTNFSIFAHGKQLDADQLIRKIMLKFDNVWRRGDPMRSCSGSLYETSGVEILLGLSESLPIGKQEKIAEEFISLHQEELFAMTCYPGVECCVLGLQYHLPFKPSRRGFCVCPSVGLLKLAIETGIRPVVYCTLDQE